MSRKTITLEIDTEHEDLLRQYAGFLEEMKDLAASAPDGTVLDACEEAVIEKGREHQRRVLQQAVQSRLDAAEKKGAPLRRCSCGQARENRGVSSREVFTCLGSLAVRRRWWGSRCPCSPGAYHADAALGLDGGLSPRLQRKACRLAADVSFATTAEHLRELLGVSPASETLRLYCERQAGRMAKWQGQETASAETFRRAEGAHEFAVDAGKVNTREKGWRDLKIAVVQKRPAADPATPAEWESRVLPGATARLMWADISASRRFRRSWHARLKRLGLPSMARLHVLGDGASWIWKAADRALSGCRQTLDIFHASQHIAEAGKRLFGEGTAEATTFHEHGRDLLLKEGWTGICRLIGEELEREDTPKRRQILDRLLNYFLGHMTRLDYAGRLASGDAIGSGVVEGAAKTLGLRLKARGARWRHKNARSMAALICCRQTDQWDLFWDRAA